SSSAKKPDPQSVWCMTANSNQSASGVLFSCSQLIQARSCSMAGVTRPPTVRATIASPRSRPNSWAGSTRGSMQVRMYTCRLGMNGMAGTRSLASVRAKAWLRGSSSSKLDMIPSSRAARPPTRGRTASERQESARSVIQQLRVDRAPDVDRGQVHFPGPREQRERLVPRARLPVALVVVVHHVQLGEQLDRVAVRVLVVGEQVVPGAVAART